MPEKSKEIKGWELTVRLHRVQQVACTRTKNLPQVPGFSIRRDRFVRQQTKIRTYARVQSLNNVDTGTSVDLQYQCKPPWLEPVKLTVVPTRSQGLQRAELEEICGRFKCPRLLTVELALDFGEGSEVDRSFVLRHGLFGRSQPVGGRLFRDLRFGTRHSDTMVRAYKRPETKSYRVEIELHSSWLRRFGITQPSDLSKLPHLLCFSRINFVAIDWDALADHLRRKGLPASALNSARSQAYSIHRALSLLRSEIGLVNVHRFLSPLRINTVIKRELEDWANRWRNSLHTSL
jgi:hypothetical protein